MKLGQDIFRLIGLLPELKRLEPEPPARPPPPPVTVGTSGFDPARPAGMPELAAVVPERNIAIARRIVRAGGSGDASDVEAVVQELAALPTWMLERAEQYRIKIVACRGGITDYLTHLRGERPRGWPPGTTWDSLPGSGGDPVVIATNAAPDGSRQVPPTGQGHGAESLVRHELAHALDHKGALGFKSTSRDFMTAYRADAGHMQHEDKDYLLQSPPAGPEEAFSEMFDWYTGDNESPPLWGPNLYALFARADQNQGGAR